MTAEEIKQSLSMPEVARQYGLQIRRDGMCSCPFHGEDKHPSMKIYKDSFTCFACGAHGDIFTFVQLMTGYSFKDAFLSLGGTYEQHETKTARAISQSRIRTTKTQRKLKEDIYKTGGKIFRELTATIELCKFIEKYHRPYTNRWCIALDALPELNNIYYEVFCTKDGKKETDGIYILTRCRKVRQRIFSGA